jgi:hypothetical protein
VRRPPVVLGMAALTCMALLVAVLLILFSVNPSVDRNEGEIRKAVMSQHAIICAQVQNTANAYRFRSLTPSGDVEPIRHFLTRMQAQQQTLRLARGSECRSAPGFPPVGLQVRRALRQIHEILQHFEPRLREPVRDKISNLSPNDSDKQGSFLPSVPRPSHAGIDEAGVPANLHDKLAPSAPVLPQTGRGHKAPPSEEQAVPEKPMPQKPNGGGPETNFIKGPERDELPIAPTPSAEVKIDTEILEVETEIP